MPDIAVTLATLESEMHEIHSINSGMKLYNAGNIEFGLLHERQYAAKVTDRGMERSVLIHFVPDGTYFDSYYCNCHACQGGTSLCKHIVAAIFAIQGGILTSELQLGMTATISTMVDEGSTARAMGSGALDVFSTPSMIALMEYAACECLKDALPEGQTSVGTLINVSHKAASPVGAKITATAKLDYVFGRKLEFSVSAHDGTREIGKGKHNRVLVDEAAFMEKAQKGRK